MSASELKDEVLLVTAKGEDTDQNIEVDIDYDDNASYSDDEEWNTYANLPRPPSFTFYQYGFHGVADSLHAIAGSFQHLGSSISDGWHKLHENYNKLSSDYSDIKEKRRSPSPIRENDALSQYKSTSTVGTNDAARSFGPTKSRASISPKRTTKNIFDVREFQKTQEREKLSTSTTITRFRPKSPTWDGSFFISKDVEEQLYRTPFRDPTGRLIFSLGRDEAKGVPAWKNPEPGKDLAPPSFTSCSESFRRMVLTYMDEVIEKVQREYKRMPENSQAKVTEKARAGADLNNLIQERNRLREDLRRLEEQEAHKNQNNSGSRKEKTHKSANNNNDTTKNPKREK